MSTTKPDDPLACVMRPEDPLDIEWVHEELIPFIDNVYVEPECGWLATIKWVIRYNQYLPVYEDFPSTIERLRLLLVNPDLFTEAEILDQGWMFDCPLLCIAFFARHQMRFGVYALASLGKEMDPAHPRRTDLTAQDEHTYIYGGKFAANRRDAEGGPSRWESSGRRLLTKEKIRVQKEREKRERDNIVIYRKWGETAERQRKEREEQEREEQERKEKARKKEQGEEQENEEEKKREKWCEPKEKATVSCKSGLRELPSHENTSPPTEDLDFHQISLDWDLPEPWYLENWVMLWSKMTGYVPKPFMKEEHYEISLLVRERLRELAALKAAGIDTPIRPGLDTGSEISKDGSSSFLDTSKTDQKGKAKLQSLSPATVGSSSSSLSKATQYDNVAPKRPLPILPKTGRRFHHAETGSSVSATSNTDQKDEAMLQRPVITHPQPGTGAQTFRAAAVGPSFSTTSKKNQKDKVLPMRSITNLPKVSTGAQVLPAATTGSSFSAASKTDQEAKVVPPMTISQVSNNAQSLGTATAGPSFSAASKTDQKNKVAPSFNISQASTNPQFLRAAANDFTPGKWTHRF